MKNLINYFYHIYPEKIYEIKNGYYFYISNIKYIFTVFERNKQEFEFLLNLTNFLYEKGIGVSTFIKTKDETFFVKHDNEDYVLIRININKKTKINLKRILEFDSLMNFEYKVSHVLQIKEIWQAIVDKSEKQIEEYNDEYKNLVEIVDYYIGLSEIAISYLNNIQENSDIMLNMAHKRIKYNYDLDDLYNPLNIIIDFNSRDLAEYIKSIYFSTIEENPYNIFTKNETIFNLNKDTAQYLLARLIFPSYFFDIFKLTIEGTNTEKLITEIKNKSSDYELFIKSVYIFLRKKYNIETIDWIEKK